MGVRWEHRGGKQEVWEGRVRGEWAPTLESGTHHVGTAHEGQQAVMRRVVLNVAAGPQHLRVWVWIGQAGRRVHGVHAWRVGLRAVLVDVVWVLVAAGVCCAGRAGVVCACRTVVGGKNAPQHYTDTRRHTHKPPGSNQWQC